MSKYLLIILLALCCDLKAQLLNKVFKITDDTTKAIYYKRCNPQEGGGYVEKIYYLNDSLYSVSFLSSLMPEIRNGKYIEYHKNGGISLDCDYLNGVKHGKSFSYYENGRLEYDEDYADGKLNGYLKSYYESGVQRRIDNYSNGEFIDGKCFGSKGQDTTYFVYSKMALFKNGDLEKYRRYVMSKLIYPKEAVEREIAGTVYVCFSVNSKGKVVDVEVIHSPNYYLSKAAVDVVLNSPDWEPAIQEGKRVKQKFVIPIIFQLQ
jgi:TonB family protein